MQITRINNSYSPIKLQNINNAADTKMTHVINNNPTDVVSFDATVKEPYRGITNKRQRLILANLIIHGAASTAAATSASLAQAPGSDEIPLTAITTTMVGGILKGCYGIPITTSMGASAAACAIGTRLGTGWWRHTISWIPGIGNGVSAATTFTLHEATGWTLVALCEKLLANGALSSSIKISREDFDKMKNSGGQLKASVPQTKEQPSFKGKNLNLQKCLLDDFKTIINIKEIKIDDDDNIFTSLSQKISKMYGIKKDSKTFKEMMLYFQKLKSHLNKNVVKTNHPQVLLNDEELIDNSLELHYWLLIALLEKNKKDNKNLNNIKIDDASFNDKDIQKFAIAQITK